MEKRFDAAVVMLACTLLEKPVSEVAAIKWSPNWGDFKLILKDGTEHFFFANQNGDVVKYLGDSEDADVNYLHAPRARFPEDVNLSLFVRDNSSTSESLNETSSPTEDVSDVGRDRRTISYHIVYGDGTIQEYDEEDYIDAVDEAEANPDALKIEEWERIWDWNFNDVKSERLVDVTWERDKSESLQEDASETSGMDMFDFIYSLFTRDGEYYPIVKNPLGRSYRWFNYSEEDIEDPSMAESEVGTDYDGNIVLLGSTEDRFDDVKEICDKYGFDCRIDRRRSKRYPFKCTILVPVDEQGDPELVRTYFAERGVPLKDVLKVVGRAK